MLDAQASVSQLSVLKSHLAPGVCWLMPALMPRAVQIGLVRNLPAKSHIQLDPASAMDDYQAVAQALPQGVVFFPSAKAGMDKLAAAVSSMPQGSVLYLSSAMSQILLTLLLNNKPQHVHVQPDVCLSDTQLRQIEELLKAEDVVDLGPAWNRNGFFNNQVRISDNPLGKRSFSDPVRPVASFSSAMSSSREQRPQVN